MKHSTALCRKIARCLAEDHEQVGVEVTVDQVWPAGKLRPFLCVSMRRGSREVRLDLAFAKRYPSCPEYPFVVYFLQEGLPDDLA